MLGSPVLDVAIGLVVVYLLLSLVCSAIREGIEAFLKTRATHLERGLRELLNDQSGTGMTKAVYSHPLIYGLFQGPYDPAKLNARGWMPPFSKLPSYIPSASFATAVLDIVTRGADSATASAAGATSTPISLAAVRAQISTIQNAPVQRAILTALDIAQGDLQKAQANIEAWYDSTMDRVSGWYKRESQMILFVLGILVAVVANVDTLAIARFLYQDKPTRDALVAEAQSLGQNADAAIDARKVITEMQQLPLPIGWNRRPPSLGTSVSLWSEVVGPILGWFTTALAISLGAPFWFDVLKRVMEIRATVKPQAKPDEDSARQSGPGSMVAAASVPSPVDLFRPHEWSTGQPREGVL